MQKRAKISSVVTIICAIIFILMAVYPIVDGMISPMLIKRNPLLQDQEIAEYNAKLGRKMVITNNLSLVFSLLILYPAIAGSIWMQTVYTGQVQVITWLGWPVFIFATIVVTIDVINFLQKNS